MSATARGANAEAEGVIDSLALRIVRRRLERVRGDRLVLALPGERVETFGPPERAAGARVAVRDPAVFRRLLLDGEAGLGEAYVDGLWETDDLVGLLAWGAREREGLGFNDAASTLVARLSARNFHRRNRPGSARASKRNVVAHYDHGNAFYRLWLDESMAYSCAVFAWPGQSLEEAQANKHSMLADKAQIRPGGRVLDIGCGWGAFARFAARNQDWDITGVTLSPQQLALARERVEQDRLGDRVHLELRDYRALSGTFDGIVSIGMFEHVGAKYWATFFRCCGALLPVGGRLALQTITVPHRSLRSHVANTGWIQRYIFPGATLPSIAAIERAASPAGLQLLDVEDIGLHYATTLHHWRERFRQNLDAVRGLGYDEPFIRRWDYYLALSEAGFLTRTTSDVQVVLEKVAP